MKQLFSWLMKKFSRRRRSYRETILAENPVAYYPLDDTLEDIQQGD